MRSPQVIHIRGIYCVPCNMNINLCEVTLVIHHRRSAHYAHTHMRNIRKKHFYNKSDIKIVFWLLHKGLLLKESICSLPLPLRVAPNSEELTGILFQEFAWICVGIIPFWLHHCTH